MTGKILRSAKKPHFLIRDRDLLQQKREAVAEAAFALFLQEGFQHCSYNLAKYCYRGLNS